MTKPFSVATDPMDMREETDSKTKLKTGVDMTGKDYWRGPSVNEIFLMSVQYGADCSSEERSRPAVPPIPKPRKINVINREAPKIHEFNGPESHSDDVGTSPETEMRRDTSFSESESGHEDLKLGVDSEHLRMSEVSEGGEEPSVGSGSGLEGDQNLEVNFENVRLLEESKNEEQRETETKMDEPVYESESGQEAENKTSQVHSEDLLVLEESFPELDSQQSNKELWPPEIGAVAVIPMSLLTPYSPLQWNLLTQTKLPPPIAIRTRLPLAVLPAPAVSRRDYSPGAVEVASDNNANQGLNIISLPPRSRVAPKPTPRRSIPRSGPSELCPSSILHPRNLPLHRISSKITGTNTCQPPSLDESLRKYKSRKEMPMKNCYGGGLLCPTPPKSPCYSDASTYIGSASHARLDGFQQPQVSAGIQTHSAHPPGPSSTPQSSTFNVHFDKSPECCAPSPTSSLPLQGHRILQPTLSRYSVSSFVLPKLPNRSKPRTLGPSSL